MIRRPAANECPPYASAYVDRVGDGDILDILVAQREEMDNLLEGIGEERAGHRYEEGKWNLKEIIGHLTDTERVFCYRALRFARKDRTPLPGYDQDEFVRNGGFISRTLADLLAEFRSVRSATITLFAGFNKDVLMLRGTASGFEFTVRSIPFITAGHVFHHLDIIKERYA
ncbi:MAG: DinB family protein [Candidatus Latescibacterota bacterium]|nr:MAG: DinB family protein [Candidatus Latescibacterota bacterium]